MNYAIVLMPFHGWNFPGVYTRCSDMHAVRNGDKREKRKQTMFARPTEAHLTRSFVFVKLIAVAS